MFHFCVKEEFSFLLSLLCIMHIYLLFPLLFENRNDIWPASDFLPVYPTQMWSGSEACPPLTMEAASSFQNVLDFFETLKVFYILQFWKGLTASCSTCVDQKLQQGFTILMGDRDPNHRDAIFNTTELCCLLRKYWQNLCILTLKM